MIGYAFCGSFCTFGASFAQFEKLCQAGYDVQPIMSENAYSTDTRFFEAAKFRKMLEDTAGREVIHTVADAEPLGPSKRLECLIISPCTGNTLAKLALGITDTAVTMAAKAHLRCDGLTLIALASNDAISANLKNIAAMLSRKSVYMLPMKQDNPVGKPHSLVADFSLMGEALEAMRSGKQLRPLFLT